MKSAKSGHGLMDFERLNIGDEDGLDRMSAMATAIVREHYDPMIGKEQNDYMIEKFQSVGAIRDQLSRGYRYYFIGAEGRTVGFCAFYPRGGAMYLSKLYLYREERGKGYSREIVKFVGQCARDEGLSSIELNVNRHNDAVFAYEKLGFKRLRTEKNDIGSGFFMDDYVYGMDV